ncbi:MAG TPA: type II toxin-antitoxin system VapB family antitoxin [Microbacteriaceae bacterium]
MPLNIKDAEPDRLIRERAAATGESITVAARHAFASVPAARSRQCCGRNGSCSRQRHYRVCSRRDRPYRHRGNCLVHSAQNAGLTGQNNVLRTMNAGCV